METKNIEINGRTLSIPSYYQQVDSAPEDPEGSIPFMAKTELSICFLLIYPMPLTDTVPNEQSKLIEGISQFITDRQALIMVEADETKACSVVKTAKEPFGMQYTLTYQRFYEDFAINVTGFFEEDGTTGIRDTMVYELCKREGSVGSADDPFAGWSIDPYGCGNKDGLMMNLSEQEQYDGLFPAHPLSMCRELIRTILGSQSI